MFLKALHQVFRLVLALLCIRDILVRIRFWFRIRILLFSSVAHDMPTKNIFFFQSVFAYYFLRLHVHCTPVFKDRKSKRSHKIVDIKIFLPFLLVDGRIRIREAQKRLDPDPQHWVLSWLSSLCCSWLPALTLIRHI